MNNSFERLDKPFENNQEKEEGIESNPRWIAQYKLFKEKFKVNPEYIYYPCCARDTSPSKAFPESKIIYTDIDSNSIEALKQAGYEAKEVSALEYDPGKIDMLIMRNPVIPPEEPASYVQKGNYILCNDYHNTASYIKSNKEFEIRARIGQKNKDELEFDTENLEDYWKTVESDEEFKESPFSFGSINYKQAALIVEQITGKKENILEEYKKIAKEAREQALDKYKEIISQEPELKEHLPNPEKEDFFMYNFQGKQFMILTSLPRKKGTVDDLFVFQRKETDSK